MQRIQPDRIGPMRDRPVDECPQIPEVADAPVPARPQRIELGRNAPAIALRRRMALRRRDDETGGGLARGLDAQVVIARRLRGQPQPAQGDGRPGGLTGRLDGEGVETALSAPLLARLALDGPAQRSRGLVHRQAEGYLDLAPFHRDDRRRQHITPRFLGQQRETRRDLDVRFRRNPHGAQEVPRGLRRPFIEAAVNVPIARFDSRGVGEPVQGKVIHRSIHAPPAHRAPSPSLRVGIAAQFDRYRASRQTHIGTLMPLSRGTGILGAKGKTCVSFLLRRRLSLWPSPGVWPTYRARYRLP